MRRHLFSDEHELFRQTVRDFIQREAVPYFRAWEAAGEVPRSLYNRLGEIGVIGITCLRPSEAGETATTLSTWLSRRRWPTPR